MARYCVFSLEIESDLVLPELVPVQAHQAATPPDLIVREADLSDARPPTAEGNALAWATSDQVCLHFEQGGQFLARQGRELLFHRDPNADDAAIRHFLLGPMLGVVLHQRGCLVLHASSVRINGGAVAFLAETGAGKSTLAAAFHSAGHTLVSDDIVPVHIHAATGPITYPCFPQLKVFPDAAAQLREGPSALPRLLPGFDKRAQRLCGDFPTEPMPLRRVYVLEDGESEATTGLAPGRRSCRSCAIHLCWEC